VLRDVMFGNRGHFRELLAGSEEKIASNIFADRLGKLNLVCLSVRRGRRSSRGGCGWPS
jgi:hypothetical protein